MSKSNLSQFDEEEDILDRENRDNKPKEVLMSWQAREYHQYELDPYKMGIVVLVSIALIIYAVVTANYLFALIIIMVMVVLQVFSKKEPTTINVSMNKEGIEVGEKTFTFEDDLKSFCILYNPPNVKALNFDRQQSILPNVVVQLEEENPLKLREMLLRYLPEDMEKEEHFSDRLARKIGI